MTEAQATIPPMTTPQSPGERIFYDGDCGVCHGSVRFVARRDPDGRAFRFAPLGGETFGREIPEPARAALPDSLVVLTADGRLLTRSAGAVRILRRLGPAWRLLGALLWLVPRPIRDVFYDRFAAHRGRLAARPEGTCPLLPPALRARFDP